MLKVIEFLKLETRTRGLSAAQRVRLAELEREDERVGDRFVGWELPLIWSLWLALLLLVGLLLLLLT